MTKTRPMTIIIKPADSSSNIYERPTKADRLLIRLAAKVGPLYRADGFWACTSLKAAIAVCKHLGRRGIEYDTVIARVVEGPHGDAVWGVGDPNGLGPSEAGVARVAAALRAAGVTYK